jgi:hypothetical protein
MVGLEAPAIGIWAIAFQEARAMMISTLIALSRYAAIVCAGVMFAMATTAPALAEVSRVVVQESGPLGTFGGRQYTWVTGAMEGTVARDDGTTGHYRVPVSIMYPDRDPNGFGLVDVVNSADFSNYLDESAPFGKRKIYYTGDVIYSDYLRREGFTYFSVQWSRMVTEALGPDYGVIENGMDGWEIIRDAARFLRDPADELDSDLPLEPGAVALDLAPQSRPSTKTYPASIPFLRMASSS